MRWFTSRCAPTTAIPAILATVFALMASAAIARAQPADPATQPGRGRGPAAMLQRIRHAMDELKLTDDQKPKIDAIFDDARARLREMLPEMQQLQPPERQQRIRELLTDLREQIVSVLTDEQQPQFEAKMEQIRRNPGGNTDNGGVLERMRGALEKIDLSDEQRDQVQAIQDAIRQKAQAARAQAGGDMRTMRKKMQELAAELREELSAVLTAEQQEKLRELMRDEAPPSMPPPAPPPMDEPKREPPKNDDKPESDGRRTMASPGSEKLRVGQEAPAFALERLDGRNVQLSSFNGKVLVMLFGNFTSPSFRQRAEDFEQLRREYGRRAEFLIVYTRESHAAGEWQVARNRDAGISIEQPKDMSGRIALAKRARETLGITMPIAMDTMDDKTAKDYDALNPTTTVVIGRDGVVVARDNWFDPTTLRKQLDEIVPAR